MPPGVPQGARGRNSPTQGRSIEKLERVHDALQMRLDGSTFQQIADALGVTKSTARRYIDQAIDTYKEATAELVSRLRAEQHARYEAIIRQHMDRALPGQEPDEDGKYRPPDHESTRTVLRAMKQQAVLWGLELQTSKVEHTGEVRLTAADLERARQVGERALTERDLEDALVKAAQAFRSAHDVKTQDIIEGTYQLEAGDATQDDQGEGGGLADGAIEEAPGQGDDPPDDGLG